MIPIRLEIRNFLPYRVCDPVRFEGIHLACLTGPNGAGKSSLLDAITWALWGRARAKRDDDLVHLGQGEMYVQLDFEQEGVTWRVIRRRAAGKGGRSELNLLILGDGGKPMLQSEAAIRQTQEKINRLLRLDYETFVHSAYLQQGKADAFTTATPAYRKKVLADILGLEQWEDYEERVKQTLKELQARIASMTGAIQEIDRDLARKPVLLAQLKEAEAAHADAQTQLEIAEARLKEVDGAPKDLNNAQHNRKAIVKQREGREYEKSNAEGDLARYLAQAAEYHATLDMRAEIEAGLNALQSARQTDQTLSDKLRVLKTVDQKRAELVGEINAARAALDTEGREVRKRIEEWERMIADHSTAALESTQAEVTALSDTEHVRTALKEDENSLRETIARLETEEKAIIADGKDLREKRETLAETDAPLCPLCGQELTTDHRQRMIAQLDEQIETRREEVRATRGVIAETKERLKAVRAQIADLDADLKRLAPLIEQLGGLQMQIEAAEQAAGRLAEDAERLAEIEAQLADESFALDQRRQLAGLDAQSAELAYDESNHDGARRQIDEHVRYEQLNTQLQIAVMSLPGVQAQADNARLRIANLVSAIAEADEQIAQVDLEIARLSVLAAEYEARDAEVRTQRTRERSAYERMVSARQDLSALDRQVERRRELEDKRERTRYQEGIYTELRKAFGKNGVPAMIIDSAMPELEAMANDLLSRMTDGRMSLRLTTQREKVTGGVAETLDIEIADELGTRNYELYSGGEAFRIDFALRVALSKLLARRAGAQLRTLFIDEGFGTQDDAGRNKLVEAITAIQDDFDLILVITHIDELRDSFPVHIVVDKTGSGSRISVR
jgi:exonuclease SbcC